MREAVVVSGANSPRSHRFYLIKNKRSGSFFYDAFNNNNLLGFDMKMQHTVYLEMRHKVILDKLIEQEKIGNGKQGTPNYNKAILQAIEAIDTAREAHFQALRRGYRLYQWIVDDERFFSQCDRLRENKPKLYQKIVEGKVSKYD